MASSGRSERRCGYRRRRWSATPLRPVRMVRGGARWPRSSRLQPVRHLTPFRLELQVRFTRLELEERGEVDVPQAVADQLDDDLVGECRHWERHVERPSGVQPQLEVLSQQVTGEGWREVEVDECRRLVAAEGGAHHAAVDELQV